MNKYCLIFLCFGSTFNAIATQPTPTQLTSLKEKVNNAIIKFEHTKKELWAYQVSRYEDEEGDISSSIEQYSPQATNQWLLKRINGQQPTEKQVKKFAKKQRELSKPLKKDGNIQLKLRKLINQDTLTLLSENEHYIVMGFNVYFEKLGKDAVGKLQGKLAYHKDKQFIEKITVWNKAEFSPMLTANITDLTITFSFFHLNGAILAKQNEMKMKGSFAYFTEINETSTDNFSGYLYHGELIQ